VSGDRDDELPPWKDRPEGAAELIRAARETPPMTEEEDRAVERVQRALAARRRGQPPRGWRRRAPILAAGGILAAGAAAAALAVALRSAPPSPGEPTADETSLDASAPMSRAREIPGPDGGRARRPPR
jgi:hypothetical protein